MEHFSIGMATIVVKSSNYFMFTAHIGMQPVQHIIPRSLATFMFDLIVLNSFLIMLMILINL